MSRQQKIDQLLAISDPNAYLQKILTDRVLAQALLEMEKIQGPKGEKPVKGIDYFTPEEIQAFVDYIRAQVKKGIDGKDGKDGESIVGPRGPQGGRGKDGYTPVRGLDYWTEKDIKQLTKTILSQVPKPAADKKEPIQISYKDIKDAPDLKDLPQLIKFLQAGGFRGGGDTVSAGSGITITTTNGVKVISTTAVSVGFQQPLTGAVDGSNQTFTWAVAPNALVVDNGRTIQKKSSDLTDNWTGTTTTVLAIAPNFDIFGIA